jgi:hypothetical protein
MGRSQRGAVMFGMGGEQARPLRDVLAEQPTTLRVLENLPGKRTTLTVDEIQQQMRRPEVTKQEKEVLERVFADLGVGGTRLYHGGTYTPGQPIRGVLYAAEDPGMARSYVAMSEERAGPGAALQEINVSTKSPAPESAVREFANRNGIPFDDYPPASAFDAEIHGEEAVNALVRDLQSRGYDHAVLDDIPYGGPDPSIKSTRAHVLFPNAKVGSNTVSAEDLVKRVQAETGNFRLTQADTQDYATYGLSYIGRDDSGRPWVGQPGNAFNPRTTVHRSPMETGASSHFTNEPNYFAHSRAFEDAQGIPHVVEIQSDLVQRAGKELSPQERQNLEVALSSVETQRRIYAEVMDQVDFTGPGSVFRQVPTLLENVLTRQAQFDAVNPDAIMLLEDQIFKVLPFEEKMKLLKPALDELEAERLAGNADAATTFELYQSDPNRFFGSANLRDGELLRRIADGSVKLDIFSAEDIRDLVSRQINGLDVLAAEHRSKLAEQATNAKLQPMFKNWERRVVREELARAAREGKPMVRFADADTVAAVEGWPRKQVVEPGTAFDSSFRGGRLVGTRAGRAADLEYTGNIRVDGSGNVTAEAFPRDVMGQKIGEPTWVATAPSNLSPAVRAQFFKQSNKLEFPEHQGIYDRYNKEVANYLKSLDAKRVTDETGNTWWEVPVKPQQRRPQIFSMGGGIVGAGAAAYNAATPAVEEQ